MFRCIDVSFSVFFFFHRLIAYRRSLGRSSLSFTMCLAVIQICKCQSEIWWLQIFLKVPRLLWRNIGYPQKFDSPPAWCILSLCNYSWGPTNPDLHVFLLDLSEKGAGNVSSPFVIETVKYVYTVLYCFVLLFSSISFHHIMAATRWNINKYLQKERNIN